MRQYTDSADAVKAYAEEVGLDLSKCTEVIDIKESEKSRGGLILKFDNYHKNQMTITIHHNWGDLYDITFDGENKIEQTLYDQDFRILMGTFNALKVAFTGVSQSEWKSILGIKDR